MNSKAVKISQQVIEYSFYSLVISVPLVFSPQSYEIFEFPKMLLVYFAAATVFTFWTIKILLTGKLNFSPTPLFYPVTAFLGSQIVSTIFSIDKITSIAGYYSRFNGGLLSTVAYIVLYFAAVSNLKRPQILNLLFLTIVSGLITAFWGIPSHFGADPTCKLITGIWTAKCWSINFDPTLRIFATFGQPNWMAGFLIMAILVLTGFILTISKIRFQVFAIIINLILFWAFLLTNSRSATLALLVALSIFTVISLFLKFHQKLKFSFFSLVILLISFGILTLISGQQLLGRIREVKLNQNSPIQSQQETQSPVFSGPTESGQIRLIVWKGAVDIFRKFPLTGSGVETFGYSYYQSKPLEHNLTSEWNFLYNKAHNEFLNLAATTGILGLGSYLILIFSYLLLTTYYLKKRSNERQERRDKILISSLVTAILAFQIHNFFGFSVVPTALFFWIILASSVILISSKKNNLPRKNLAKFKPKPQFILLSLAFLVFSLISIFNFYSSDLSFSKGLLNYEGGNYYEAVSDFQQAIKSSPLPQSLFLAYAAYNLAILSQTDESLVSQAVNFAEKATSLSEFNLTTQRLTTNTYFELASGKPEFKERTLKAAKKLVKIAPTDAETHYQVAQILKILGEDKEAESIMKSAIKLKPNYQEAIDTLAEWQRQD